MTKNSKIQFHRIIFIIAVAFFVAVLCLIVLIFFNQENGQRGEMKSSSVTHITRGKITEKYTSCGREILQPDGAVERGGWICDSGNSIVVNGLHISTGGGALTGIPERVSDIKFLHAGDQVEVRYIKDKDGRASTNCESCYVEQ